MNETPENQLDVLVVGGGMVGAAMAALLVELPLRVGLIDRADWSTDITEALSPEHFAPRVSALTAASKGMLQRLGVWSAISEFRCCPYQSMEVWDGEGTGLIRFSARDIDEPELGTIVENDLITSALRRRLGEASNFQLFSEQEILAVERLKSGDWPMLARTSCGTKLTARLLIAADGGRSTLRSLAGFKTREWDYGQQALVTTVRTSLPHQFTAWQRFLESGPLAFLPLLPQSNSNVQDTSSIVWSTTPAEAAELVELSDVDFCSRLGAAFEYRLGDITECAQRTTFPLRQCHAVDYVQAGIALVGDAAHTIHPLAGQGANLGFLDVMALADEIRHGLRMQRMPGDPALLRRYQRARRGHNLIMMGVMEGFKRLFSDPESNRSLALRWLRNRGMALTNAVPVVKNELARKALGQGSGQW